MKKACLMAMCAAIAALNGCETGGSADSTIRQVSANFTGVYENGGEPLASSQSGAAVTILSLHQTGDRLEAFDNRDGVWKGTIGEVFVTDEGGGARAPFTLEGDTSAGQQVTITGTLSAQNNDASAGASAVMSGTWIEETLFATFFAEGTISSIQQPPDDGGNGTNTTTLAISPSGTITMSGAGDTEDFTASGGSGNYTWSVANTLLGNLSSSSGSSVTYTRTSSDGTQTVRVSDGTTTKSTSVVQN
jgi:hypothetical protein